MVKEIRSNKWPVVILDPQLMALNVIARDRDGVESYIVHAMRHAGKTKRDYIMFACNTGGHWIAVVISLAWACVWYLDSYRMAAYESSILTEVLDR